MYVYMCVCVCIYTHTHTQIYKTPKLGGNDFTFLRNTQVTLSLIFFMSLYSWGLLGSSVFIMALIL